MQRPVPAEAAEAAEEVGVGRPAGREQPSGERPVGPEEKAWALRAEPEPGSSGLAEEPRRRGVRVRGDDARWLGSR